MDSSVDRCVITIHVNIQIVVQYLYVHMYKYFGMSYMYTHKTCCVLYMHYLCKLVFAYIFSLVFGSTWWLRWAAWVVENNMY